MKKILLAIAVVLVFAACDDSKTATDSTTTDSTIITADTSSITPVVIDSTASIGVGATKTSKDTASKKY